MSEVLKFGQRVRVRITREGSIRLVAFTGYELRRDGVEALIWCPYDASAREYLVQHYHPVSARAKAMDRKAQCDIAVYSVDELEVVE